MTTDYEDYQPVTAMEPIPVSLDPETLAAIRGATEYSPVFGAWQTLAFTGIPGDLQPQQLLPADLKRIRAYIQLTAPPVAASNAAGNVLNPGATTTIAQLTVPSLVPGVWLVNVTIGLEGTVAAGDANNMRLRVAGTTFLNYQYPAVAGLYPQPPEQVTFPAGAATGIQVQSVAASSGGGVTYTAEITATYVGAIAGAGYVLVGQLGQVSNGQGGKIFIGQPRWELRNHAPLWIAGDGLTPMTVTTLVERNQGL